MKKVVAAIILLIALIISIFILKVSKQSIVSTAKNININEDVRIPILMFHHLDTKVDESFNSTVITPDEFEETLTELKNDGYNTISISQLNNIYEQGDTNIKKPIVITFDDGYSSNYEYAYPLLKKYNMKAAIFVVTSTVGKKPGLFPHFSWEQAKEMESSGLIEIYNHTYSHKTADSLSEEEFVESVRLAQKDLDENIGKKSIKAFAYPQGRYTNTIIKKLKEDGYNIQLTVDNGNNKIKDKAQKLKRINVAHTETGKKLISMLDTDN